MQVDERSSGAIFFALAAIVFVVFVGVLVKLHLDAETSPSAAPPPPVAAASGVSAADVTTAYRARASLLPAVVRREVHDVGCSTNSDGRSFTCKLFLSPDGKEGLVERYLLRPVAHCTGTEHCLPVGSRYFSVHNSGETKVSGA